MKKIALAYCIDNLDIAEVIAQGLKHTSYSLEHFYCKRSSQELPLAEQLKSFNGHILLLVSDNFLKSISCMNTALNLLQNRSAHILPVVIDGYSQR